MGAAAGAAAAAVRGAEKYIHYWIRRRRHMRAASSDNFSAGILGSPQIPWGWRVQTEADVCLHFIVPSFV
jgi:hypothetical protein